MMVKIPEILSQEYNWFMKMYTEYAALQREPHMKLQ